MILSDTRKAGPYAGNGITKTFPFSFKVFSTADVQVLRTDAAGVETQLTGGFSVNLNANQDTQPGGQIVLASPLAAGIKLTLLSVVSPIQTMQLTNNGGFFPRVLNDSADRAIILIQQLYERVSRTLTTPASSDEPTNGLQLPSAAARAGKLVAFDAAGRLIPVNSSSGGGDGGLRTDLAQPSGGALIGTGLGGGLSTLSGFLSQLLTSVGSTLIGFAHGYTGATLRSIQDRLRDSVSVKDFGAKGDGVTDDTIAILAARDTGRDVFFPEGVYLTSQSIAARTNQRLFGRGGNVELRGTHSGWTMETIGYPSATIATLTMPVAVDPYVWTLTFNTTANMSAGMRILLHDPVTDQFEVNIVEQVVSNSVVCRWPILQPFPTPGRVLVRRIDAIENARVQGMRITNTGGGGCVRWLYTDNCGVVDCTVGPNNYIGLSFENSVFSYAERIAQNNCGASGVGFRNVRGFRVDFGTVIKTPRSDEPYTVYYNSGPGRFKACDAVGELFGQPGTQGNSYLIDTRCAGIDIEGCSAEGSRTVHVLITGSLTAAETADSPTGFAACRDINIVNNRLGRANLGHIKVEGKAQRVMVDGNICASLVDAVDGIEGGAASAAIRIKADCSDCFVGPGNRFSNLVAGSRAIDDQQSAPHAGYMRQLGLGTTSPYLTNDVRGGTNGVTESGFVRNTTGAAIRMEIASGVPTIVASQAGDSNIHRLRLEAINVSVPAPSYATDAAADADTALPSGALYRIGTGRTTFRKP